MPSPDPDDAGPVIERLVAAARARLAVYGSLAPGERHHRVLTDLPGEWTSGMVRGRLFRIGWGESFGYPGLVWDPDGPPVPVKLFHSPSLVSAWERLDEFEGPDYRRILVPVDHDGGLVVAHLYEVRP